MRITKIEIKNFRAFYGAYQISHTTITNIPKKEIEDAIEAVERLEAALG